MVSRSHITIQFSVSSCGVDFTFYCSIIVILNYSLFSINRAPVAQFVVRRAVTREVVSRKFDSGRTITQGL